MTYAVSGVPSIGPNRELKFALEKFWKKEISEEELREVARSIRRWWTDAIAHHNSLAIPVGSFSYYDRMLDLTDLFSLLPSRFAIESLSPLERYFAAARGWSDGADSAVPLAMKKWFNTNYHYLVPELSPQCEPRINEARFDQIVAECREQSGAVRFSIIGPCTFLALARFRTGSAESFLNRIVPAYVELFERLKQANVSEIVIDEPIFVTEGVPFTAEAIEQTYRSLAHVGIPLWLNTFFDAITDFKLITNLPVATVGIDVTSRESLDQLIAHGFPSDKTLAAGVISGRSVWAMNPHRTKELIAKIASVVPRNRLILTPSCSLLHLPHTVEPEQFPESIKEGIAFALEKIDELKALSSGNESKLRAAQQRFDHFSSLEEKTVAKVREQVAAQDRCQRGRSLPFDQRIAIQTDRLQLPKLPTTTIGSFPQSREVRRQRQAWRKGELSDRDYGQFIRNEIRRCIEIQEEIGLDVLVHGEFERNDMVEYFGEKLRGFIFSRNGWVQSYGSRCVKPPLLYGDVSRESAITVEETVYAQTCSSKPVKGMLTGPITILNWSFVRDDISWYETAKQVAIAIGDEVIDLESRGIAVIQVDEAALREGVPLKSDAAKQYLANAVDLFVRTVERTNPTTQIHTHMCYSQFSDIANAIIGFDADVITVECTRDGGTLFETFGKGSYPFQIGPGIYDIHSPIVPSVENFRQRIAELQASFLPDQLWVNPDCGLKTRNWEEVVPSLKNMVEAVRSVR